MSIRWEYEDNGILVFRVSGKLSFNQLNNVQLEAEEVIQQSNIKSLIFVENFAGWDDSDDWGDWGDFSFIDRNDQFIVKMAIVGDPKWKELTYAFTLKGLRKFPIEYFNEDQEEHARLWLAD